MDSNTLAACIIYTHFIAWVMPLLPPLPPLAWLWIRLECSYIYLHACITHQRGIQFKHIDEGIRCGCWCFFLCACICAVWWSHSKFICLSKCFWLFVCVWVSMSWKYKRNLNHSHVNCYYFTQFSQRLNQSQVFCCLNFFMCQCAVVWLTNCFPLCWIANELTHLNDTFYRNHCELQWNQHEIFNRKSFWVNLTCPSWE